MRMRRNTSLLVELPTGATGDIAFNLIVFFLVCASIQPDSGRHQTLPRSEEVEEQKEEKENIEVEMSRNDRVVTINGNAERIADVLPRLRQLLLGKVREEDKVVIVKSKPDTPYHHWLLITGLVEEAGGIITIQTEEEREVRLPE